MVQHGGLRMVVCLEEHQVHMLQGRSTFLDDESEMDMRLFWSRPVPNEDTIDNKYIHAKTERMCLWSVFDPDIHSHRLGLLPLPLTVLVSLTFSVTITKSRTHLRKDEDFTKTSICPTKT